MLDAVRVGLNFVIICTIRLLFAGVYRKSISTFLPSSVLSRIVSPKGLPDERLRKLHENIFYSVWHSVSFVLVLVHLSREAWVFEMIESRDPRHCATGWPHFIDYETSWIYFLQLAFWLSCLAFMAVETVRKDFREMLVHHCSTITLVSLSYRYSYFRIGFVVMLLHDVGDIFLYSAKVCNYLKKPIITNVLFITFVFTFFISRLVLFPQVIRAAWGPVTGYLPVGTALPGCYILPLMLTVLLILHCMWFVLILRMLYRMMFVEKDVKSDIRSDDEVEEVSNTKSVPIPTQTTGA